MYRIRNSIDYACLFGNWENCTKYDVSFRELFSLTNGPVNANIEVSKREHSREVKRVDYEKLLEVMGKKNISIQMMYRELGISRTAFYRKCHGKSEFTQSEIQHIVDFLQLDSPVGIFFADKVS